jgi:hypothetical protein
MVAKRWLFLTLAILIANPIVGRSEESPDAYIWLDVHTIYNFSDRWRYEGDYGYRPELNGDNAELYVRPAVRYRVNPWFSLHGGIKIEEKTSNEAADTFEIRPWQGFQFHWPEIGGYTLSHYLRVGEYMTWQTQQGGSDFDFFIRARYRLGLKSPNYDILFKDGVYLTGSMEAFADLESPLSDMYINQLRFFAGPGINVSASWRIEVLLGLRQERSSRGVAFSTDEQILRLRIYYTFN